MGQTVLSKTPFDFQVIGADFLAKQNRALFDDCGLGKTLQAVLAAKRAQGPVLVLTLKRAKDQWADEIQTDDPTNTNLLVSIDAGHTEWDVLNSWFKPKRLDRPAWFVSHYEGVLRNWERYSQYNWSCIVLDEAHRVRNPKSKAFMHLMQLKSDYKIALTATPIERSPADCWTILRWLDRKEFTSYWGFFDYFVDYKLNPFGGRTVRGFKKESKDEWAQLVSKYALRRTKAEVASQLPPKIESVIPIALTGVQADLYKRIGKESEIDLRPLTRHQNAPDELFINGTLAKLIRLQQILTDPTELGVNAPSAKLEWLYDWMDTHTDPVVIMTQFRGVAERLADRYRCECIMGGSTATPLKFMKGHDRVLVGTIAAMGTGLNLQRARHLVFIDRMWSWTKMQQAIDRVHRIDITEPKQIIYLQGIHTIDLLISKALQQKWNDRAIFDELTLNWRDYGVD